jgi:hypothetical protein
MKLDDRVNDIRQKNLEIIRLANPILYNKILSVDNEKSIEFDEYKQTITSMIEKCEIHLNSIYNENDEFDLLFNGISYDINELTIFGIGNGSIIRYIQTRFKSLKDLIIIEPSQRVFLFSLGFIDFEKFKNIQVKFLVNLNDEELSLAFLDILKKNNLKNLKIYKQFSYRQIYNARIKIFETTVLNYLTDLRISMATSIRNIQQNIINTINNFDSEINLIDFTNKKNLNKTVVIAAAGPSLNSSLDIIKEYRSNIILVAVGSAIGIVKNRGFIADYNIAVDAFEKLKILDGCEFKNSNLILDSTLSFEFTKKFNGNNLFIVLNNNYFAKYLFKKINIQVDFIKSQYSVATMALDIISQLFECDILLIGQDLSYKNGQMYSIGSWNDESISEINNNFYQTVLDKNGEPVLTDIRFLGMRDQISKFVKETNNRRIFNATNGGLKIENVEDVILEEFLKKDYVENGIYAELDKLSIKFHIRDIYLQLIDEINKISDILLNLINLLSQIIDINFLSQNKEHYSQIKFLEENLLLNDFYKEVIYNDTHYLRNLMTNKIVRSTDFKERINNMKGLYLEFFEIVSIYKILLKSIIK